ncbi:O antigen biosynthesis abequosyltransferase rfbV, putative [Lentisphaera araneosa HTCC2155]|uniref:O antigen biosynthesis abequosyltransferase rfbV, putative n=1 Tax=Lentisphaera araneosa HTCC2155 TaxID=313628 RepID=A6DT14_9BACT|nr:glycosyltransferase family 2 protein [Lentisphaera araneosa]EDM25189.1 O antigen biosynthesis abequosyltransferase rfbV, putative [Lentisphaera araneosa HTCC2155]
MSQIEYNQKLSIVVPTYNRAQYIDKFIELHLPQLCEFNVALYIFDNASTDSTEEVIKQWKNKSHLIQYINNEENIGAIKNVERALCYPETDYIWMVGDTNLLPLAGIKRALEEINIYSPDCMVFNLKGMPNRQDKTYSGHSKVLSELGSITSNLSTIVHKKSVIMSVDWMGITKCFYPHTVLLYRAIAKEHFTLRWIGSSYVRGLELPNTPKIAWSNGKEVFEIGLRNWSLTIMDLPSIYSLRSKFAAINDFLKITELCTFPRLLFLRACASLNYSTAVRYKKEFKQYIKTPYCVICIISISPRNFCSLIICCGSIVKAFLKNKMIWSLFKGRVG